MEEVPEEEAPLEEAQKEAIRLNEASSEYLDESVVDGCMVSKQREYNLLRNKERVDVADGSVEAFSLVNSCFRLVQQCYRESEFYRR